MYDKKKVDDSLEFCRQIQYYKDFDKTRNKEIECVIEQIMQNIYSNQDKTIEIEDQLVGRSEEIQVSDDARQQAKTVDETEKPDIAKQQARTVDETEKPDIARQQAKTVDETEKPDIAKQQAKTVDEIEVADIPKRQLEKKGLKWLPRLKKAGIFMFCILASYAAACAINFFLFSQASVQGDSMNPQLKNNDSVIYQKIQYAFQKPKRFDIIVFPNKQLEKKDGKKDYYVKRIVGLPGEVIQIKEGSIYINNKKMNVDIHSTEYIKDGGQANNPVKIGKNQYFVLGDNRNASGDSRNKEIGLVSQKKIIGKVCFRIWPISKIGMIR